MHHTQGTVRILHTYQASYSGIPAGGGTWQRAENDSLWTGVQSHKPQGILLVYDFLSWKTRNNYKPKRTAGSSQPDSICRLMLRFQEGGDLPKVTEPF